MENSLDVGVVLQIKRQTLATLAELAREPKPTYKIDGAVVSGRNIKKVCDKRSTGATNNLTH